MQLRQGAIASHCLRAFVTYGMMGTTFVIVLRKKSGISRSFLLFYTIFLPIQRVLNMPWPPAQMRRGVFD